MVSSIKTVSFSGLKAELVEVQVHIGDGLPSQPSRRLMEYSLHCSALLKCSFDG